MTDPTQTPTTAKSGSPAAHEGAHDTGSSCCTPSAPCTDSVAPGPVAPGAAGPAAPSGPAALAATVRPNPAAKPAPPRAHLLQDPRLRPLLGKAMRKYRLEEYFEHTVVRLVTGETDPRSLVCCNTGCRPCAKDYLGAADTVLRELAKKKKKKKRFLFW
jgi:hypothetical protein